LLAQVKVSPEVIAPSLPSVQPASLYGFAKSDAANVEARDLADLHLLAAKLLRFSEAELDIAIGDGNLIEVKCDDKALS
jgi:hypothetical protein